MNHDELANLRHAIDVAATALMSDLSGSGSRLTESIRYEMKLSGRMADVGFILDTAEPHFEIEAREGVDWRLICYKFADHVQDAVVELTRSPRPACPIHGDMMTPDIVEGRPSWLCSYGAWQAPMGEYWSSRDAQSP